MLKVEEMLTWTQMLDSYRRTSHFTRDWFHLQCRSWFQQLYMKTSTMRRRVSTSNLRRSRLELRMSRIKCRISKSRLISHQVRQEGNNSRLLDLVGFSHGNLRQTKGSEGSMRCTGTQQSQTWGCEPRNPTFKDPQDDRELGLLPQQEIVLLGRS